MTFIEYLSRTCRWSMRAKRRNRQLIVPISQTTNRCDFWDDFVFVFFYQAADFIFIANFVEYPETARQKTRCCCCSCCCGCGWTMHVPQSVSTNHTQYDCVHPSSIERRPSSLHSRSHIDTLDMNSVVVRRRIGRGTCISRCNFSCRFVRFFAVKSVRFSK